MRLGLRGSGQDWPLPVSRATRAGVPGKELAELGCTVELVCAVEMACAVELVCAVELACAVEQAGRAGRRADRQQAGRQVNAVELSALWSWSAL